MASRMHGHSTEPKHVFEIQIEGHKRRNLPSNGHFFECISPVHHGLCTSWHADAPLVHLKELGPQARCCLPEHFLRHGSAEKFAHAHWPRGAAALLGKIDETSAQDPPSLCAKDSFGCPGMHLFHGASQPVGQRALPDSQHLLGVLWSGSRRSRRSES